MFFTFKFFFRVIEHSALDSEYFLKLTTGLLAGEAELLPPKNCLWASELKQWQTWYFLDCLKFWTILMIFYQFLGGFSENFWMI